jgi:predicted aspartyl protease
MRGLAAIGLAIALSAGAPAPSNNQTVPPTPAPQTEAPTGLEHVLLLLGDAQARMTVPVSIDKTGPYNFIVDTGSERSVVSRELAGQLNLAPGPDVRVTAMTGASIVDTVIVPSLHISRITSDPIEAPALERKHLGAPGMIGIDALQGHAVSIDFDRHEMTVRPARRHHGERLEPGEIVVRAKNRFGQLIVTDAYYHGHRISVVIDTGSPITIGNLALRRKIRVKPEQIGLVKVISATGGTLTADYFEIDHLTVGDARFSNVPIAFANVAPFKRFDLIDKPALLLGMDTLRLFHNVDIDFANREIRFVIPRAGRRDGGSS